MGPDPESSSPPFLQRQRVPIWDPTTAPRCGSEGDIRCCSYRSGHLQSVEQGNMDKLNNSRRRRTSRALFLRIRPITRARRSWECSGLRDDAGQTRWRRSLTAMQRMAVRPALQTPVRPTTRRTGLLEARSAAVPHAHHPRTPAPTTRGLARMKPPAHGRGCRPEGCCRCTPARRCTQLGLVDRVDQDGRFDPAPMARW